MSRQIVAAATALLVLLPRLLWTAEIAQVASDFDARRPPVLAVTASGDALVGFYDSAGHLLLHNGSQTVALSSARPSGLSLSAVGEQVYALWRERRERRNMLVLRVSPDSGKTWREALLLDDGGSAPLTRFAMTGEGDRLWAAWLGESSGQAGARRDYHIFSRASADGGLSWSGRQQLTQGYRNSVWPALSYFNDKAYAFSWSQNQGIGYLIVSHAEQDGVWQEPVVLTNVGDVLLLKTAATTGRVLAVWLEKRGKNYLLRSVSSADGRRWQNVELPGSAGLDVANLDLVVHDEQVYLAFSARTAEPSPAWKQTVYFTRSPDGGSSWEEIQPLRHYPYMHTHALYPRLTWVDGQLLAVWNDFRNIRGDLYFNFSGDQGRNWQRQDRALDAPGRHNDFLFPFATALLPASGQAVLLAGRRNSDLLNGPSELLLHRFSPTVQTKSSFSTQATPAELEQRVKTYWQALTRADYAAAYPLLDPFFRAQSREVDYLAATGRVDFQSFEIKNLIIHGNIAQVSIGYRYSVPELTVKQARFSQPPAVVEQTETWLYVGDAWYKEYWNPLGEFSYARY